MVFTYVDGDDPVYLETRSRYRSELPDTTPSKSISDSGDVDIRFRNVGEITFSVNSVLKYLPWIRTIFIVTETPRLPVSTHLLNSGRVRIIDPAEFIPSRYLPTFSSNVIESFLHRIEGLSEIFLYNNDDYMHFAFIRPDFFYSTGENGAVSLELHAYPAVFRWIKCQYSHISNYHTNLHTVGISNAYLFLRRCTHRLAAHNILAPVHATKIWRKSTARQVEKEFGSILEETRRRRFRDARDLSYYTILYSMEKKWNPHDRLHLHLFGNLSAWNPHHRLYLRLWGNFSAPHAMFDFPITSVSENGELFWKEVDDCQAQLACLNNIPPSERRRFEDVMMKKGLGAPTLKAVSGSSRERERDHV